MESSITATVTNNSVIFCFGKNNVAIPIENIIKKLQSETHPRLIEKLRTYQTLADEDEMLNFTIGNHSSYCKCDDILQMFLKLNNDIGVVHLSKNPNKRKVKTDTSLEDTFCVNKKIKN